MKGKVENMEVNLLLRKEDYLDVVDHILSTTREGKKEVWIVRAYLFVPVLLLSICLYLYFKDPAYFFVGVTFGFITLVYHSKKNILDRHKAEVEKEINKKRFGMVKYSIEENGVWKEIGGDKQFVTWKSVGKVKKTSRQIWFQASGNLIYIFPKTGFATENDYDAFFKLLHDNSASEG